MAGDPPGTCSGGPSGPENGPTGIGCYYACPVNPQSPESCDGKDNNCDGCVDNGLSTPGNFCATQGVCNGRVIPIQCNGASGWKCNYSGVPNIELDAMGNLRVTEAKCDGLDGNCNGVSDLDGFPNKGQACTAGVGVCQNPGNFVCNGAQTATVCNATATPSRAVDEACNGKDDNCDGQIDERTPSATLTCNNGGAHTCLGWRDPMTKITNTLYIYEYEATRPDASGTSQGGNSTRACANLGVLPWSNVTETQAAAACGAIRDSANNPMRLCTAPEWQQACEGPTPPAPPLWSFTPGRQTYTAQVCNDENEAATPAVWATGTQGAFGAAKLCYSDWSAVDPGPAVNRIYDMSGNLMEWTSTTVSSGGSTYFKVRGGAFTSPQGGATCEFDFDIFLPTFANNDVGFRCCSGAAP